MTPEQFMRRALDAMAQASGGKPVQAPNSTDGRTEQFVALDMAAARVAREALEDAL